MMMRGASLAALATLVTGHGALTIPVPRNNFGRVNPANKNAGNPIPGSKLPPSHINEGPCAGGACLWFSEGCYIGCDNCTARMPTGGNQIDRPPSYCTPLEPSLPHTARTFNAANKSANGDWTMYHPWRAPGRAPVLDSCGIAGGYTHATGGGGETPPGAKQGDNGTALPAGRSETWKASSVAEVGWMLDANHGGGYQYSVCPKDAPLVESCFNAHVLPFVGTNHTIRYLDSRPELVIPARDVSLGTFPQGSAWRINPIPACNCDIGRGCGLDPETGPTGRAYANDTAKRAEGQTCNTGLQFYPLPFPYGDNQQIWDRASGEAADDWIIVDHVRTPSKPGEYVLRWRWDTEQNPQVWTNCADIVVE